MMRSKLMMVALLGLGAAGVAQGSDIANDSFGYGAGDLTGANGGSGWAGAWNFVGPEGAANGYSNLKTSETGLTYTGMTTSGGAIAGDAFDGREFRSVALQNTGEVWTSVLMQVNGSTVSSANMASIGHFNSGTQFSWIAVRSNQVQLYTRNAANTAYLVDTTTPYTNGDTVLVVMRTLFGGGTAGSDLVDYWVNPTAGGTLTTGDASHVVTHDGAGVAFNQVRASMNSSASNANYIDEIRIGTSYADVVPVPEPGSLALLALGGCAMLRRRR